MGQTTAPKSFAQPVSLGTTNQPTRLLRKSTADSFIQGPQLRGNPSLMNTPTVASPNSTNTATMPGATMPPTSINPQRYVGSTPVDEDTYWNVQRNPVGKLIAR
jgi:hypothetical protein